MERVVLTPDELPRLLSAMAALARHHNRVAADFAGMYPIYPPARQLDETADLIARGEARVEAFTEDGEILGYCHASYSGGNGEIDFLYVAPDARGDGLGSTLLESALDWLRAQGAAFVDLTVVDGNPAADLFARYGFRPRCRVLSRCLNPDGESNLSATGSPSPDSSEKTP